MPKHTTSIAVHLPPDLADRFRALCAEIEQPASSVLREMIEAYCDDTGVA